MKTLIKRLKGLDKQSYGAYKSIKGVYDYGLFKLSIDHVQGDPFAVPSRVSIVIQKKEAGFSKECWATPIRQIAFVDYLARQVKKSCNRFVKGRRGSGKSGEISIFSNLQQVLKRNSVNVFKESIEIRLSLGLPANGRRIAAHEAIEMFNEEIPKIIEHSLIYKNISGENLKQHINSVEDQNFLRNWIKANNYVAFVANDSILPRRSGVDDKPLLDNPISFKSPESLETTVNLPNFGELVGMAIPKGVTLIVGGGFHGKSTLLNALELGVYNHIPDDGREKVVTDPGAVKIRAEDGRSINNVDISCFIDHLPMGKDTHQFSSENASGSTSQAANIVEAITAGSKLLLIDEDTSASNFMIRDARMQALVADDKEPITPLVFRIRDLYEKHVISSIIVMGGSGDYFSVADNVIMLDEYHVFDVSERAKEIALSSVSLKSATSVSSYVQKSKRKPSKQLISGRRGKYEFKFDVRSIHELRYGEHNIDLSGVEQLIDHGQTQSIAWIIKTYLQTTYKSHDDIVEGIKAVFDLIEDKGLDCLTEYKLGSLALPRLYEVLATINRIRSND